MTEHACVFAARRGGHQPDRPAQLAVISATSPAIAQMPGKRVHSRDLAHRVSFR